MAPRLRFKFGLAAVIMQWFCMAPISAAPVGMFYALRCMLAMIDLHFGCCFVRFRDPRLLPRRISEPQYDSGAFRFPWVFWSMWNPE